MRRIQKLPVFYLFIFCLNHSVGQETDTNQKLIDSILNVVPSQKGKTQFMSYIRLNNLYGRKNPKKGKEYLERANELAKKMEDNKLLGLVIHQMANYHSRISEFAKAEKLYFEAISMYENAKYNYEMPLVYNSLGITLKNLGKTSQAIDAYNRALEYNKSENFKRGDLTVYSNLGVLYAEMGNFKVSNEYYVKVETMAQQMNNEYQIHLARSNRATNLVQSKDYEKALKLYFEAIPVFEKGGRKLVLGEQYFLIGSAYLEMDSLQKAVENLDKSIALSNKTGETAMLGMAKRKIGEVYFKQRNYKAALSKFQQSLQISKQTSNNIEISNDYLNLSNAYEKLGDLPKAYENRKLYFIIHDSVFSEESKQKLNNLEVKFKTEKSRQEVALQKKEIALLEQQKRTASLQRIGLVAGLVLSIFLFGLGYYAVLQRMKRNKIEKEKIATELQLKEAELTFKKKELTTHALHLAKKNEVLEDIKQKAAALKTTENGSQGYQQLIHTINYDQQDDKNWENFTQYFEQVHKDFSKTVKAKYPEVTKNELRLMALLKMNLSSKEIATLLNISPDGVKKARQRLRKKMELSPDESLESTVLSI